MCLIEFQLFKTLERGFTHPAFREEPSANYFISSSYSFCPTILLSIFNVRSR